MDAPGPSTGANTSSEPSTVLHRGGGGGGGGHDIRAIDGRSDVTTTTSEPSRGIRGMCACVWVGGGGGGRDPSSIAPKQSTNILFSRRINLPKLTSVLSTFRVICLTRATQSSEHTSAEHGEWVGGAPRSGLNKLQCSVNFALLCIWRNAARSK